LHPPQLQGGGIAIICAAAADSFNDASSSARFGMIRAAFFRE